MKPLEMPDVVSNLEAARQLGVLLVRDMGAPGSITLELPDDPLLPDVVASGRQLAVEGGFFPDAHDPVPPGQLVAAALAEINRGATWVKVLTDWETPELTYPLTELKSMVESVHDAGGRVAAHSQHAGVSQVVRLGVDSIEHGTGLDVPTLELMAERGVAWAPTTGAFQSGLEELEALAREDLPPERRERLNRGLAIQRGWVDTLSSMVPVAIILGVPVLASTDNAGTVADEVRRFIEWGVDPERALRAATTDARQFLGVPSLTAGAPADVVTFQEDPRVDPTILGAPTSVLRHGYRIA
jgi:imidazolonepropionase-like amidohydrolase